MTGTFQSDTGGTSIPMLSEKRQMDEHVEQMKGALRASLSEHYQTLKEMLKMEEGVFLTPRVAAWGFGLFMAIEMLTGIALVMWLK